MSTSGSKSSNQPLISKLNDAPKTYGSNAVDGASETEENSFDLNRRVSPPLLGVSRFADSFNRSKSSQFILATVVLCAIMAVLALTIFSLGLARIFGPAVPPHKPSPGKSPPTLLDPFDVFLTYPKAKRLGDTLEQITSGVRVAGKNESFADWIQLQFEHAGIQAQKVTYYPYMNYPKYKKLSILDPDNHKYDAKLREEPIEEDPTSRDVEAFPTFHGYSAEGNVTARLVYANYGTLEDFQLLEDNGISVTGRIVLVKYGKIFRGVKVMAAQKFGAVGVIIYSDPADDGYTKGATYPKGPWRSPSSVQRGSVQFLSLYPGDPLTPGSPALSDAERLAPDEAASLPKIPSLPISYEDALPLIRLLKGHGKRAKKLGSHWEGGLKEKYFVGPSKGHVHLVNEVYASVTPIWNVIAKIPGTDLRDEAVILGNHRDSWSFGAVDPGSGTAAMVEVARTLGHLLKHGWKPRRTLYLASWDGEEYGLVGSTEWCEHHAQFLKERVVTYINADMSTGTQFNAWGTPSLNRFMRTLTRSIPDPTDSNSSLYDNWNRLFPKTPGPVLKDLGSGSDYTPFYQNLGIPSLDVRFEGEYGVYHSNYDSFHWFSKFGDPTFSGMLSLTRFLGLAVTHLTNATILPFHPHDYTDRIKKEVGRLDKEYGKIGDKRGISFQSLKKSASRLDIQTQNFLDKLSQYRQKYGNKPCDNEKCIALAKVFNSKLSKFEQKLIDPEGLPSRPFYKHIVFAPGLWQGYGSETFPGLRESARDHDWKLLKALIANYTTIFDNAAEFLQEDLF